MSLRSLIIVAGIAALMVAMTLPAFAWEPGVTGYSQFRYLYSDVDDDADFEAARIRLMWQDAVNDEGTQFCVQFDLAGVVEDNGEDSVELKDAWISHPWNEMLSTRLGFGTTMFGFDLPYPSSQRLPFERARITQEFFPGERDLGIYLTYRGDTDFGPVVDVGLTNGMDDWHDADNESQSFVARLTAPFDSGEVGVSYMTSDRQSATYDVEPDVWGAHVRYDASDSNVAWAFQGEYMDGEYLAGDTYYDADGWYALAEFTPPESDATLFYRYEERDRTPLSVVVAQAGSTESYEAHTFGVAWDFMDLNRLTLQIKDVDDAGTTYTDVGVQWQISYR